MQNYEISCVGTTLLNGTVRCDNTTYGRVIPLTDVGQSSVNYYWWNAGSRAVQYTITIAGTQYSATVNFNVSSPTVSMGSIRGPIVIDSDSQNNKWLRHGDEVTPGIVLAPSINMSGTTGSTQWIQLYNIFHRLKRLDNSTWLRLYKSGLDTTYPYPKSYFQGNFDALTDIPAQQLTNLPISKSGPVTFSRAEINDTVATYFMFKPNTANSIWVPLTLVNWSWLAVAEMNAAGNYDVLSSSTPGPTINPTVTFPEWTGNVRDVTYQPE